MAVAFDAQATADTNITGAINTISAVHTCGSISNGVAYAALCTDNSGDLQTELASGVVTYAGAAMTFVAKAILSGQNIFLYRKLAPASGANTVVFTWTTVTQCILVVASFSDVHQATPERNVATAGATSALPTLGVTSAVGDLVIALVNFNNDDSLTDGSGQTRIAFDLQGANGIEAAIMTSKAGASGTVTSSWTPAGSDRWGIISMSLQIPAAGSGSLLTRRAGLTGGMANLSGNMG